MFSLLPSISANPRLSLGKPSHWVRYRASCGACRAMMILVSPTWLIWTLKIEWFSMFTVLVFFSLSSSRVWLLCRLWNLEDFCPPFSNDIITLKRNSSTPPTSKDLKLFYLLFLVFFIFKTFSIILKLI